MPDATANKAMKEPINATCKAELANCLAVAAEMISIEFINRIPAILIFKATNIASISANPALMRCIFLPNSASAKV